MTAPIHPAIDDRAWGVLPCSPMQPVPRVIHLSEIVADPGSWVLTEEHVPESKPHRTLCDRLQRVLEQRMLDVGRNAQINCSLALRWDREHPQFGLDPDVSLVEPPPPEGDKVESLLLWRPGHVAPQLAVEIVSPSHPFKDYVTAPEKYAASGTFELWILDPRLEGPSRTGGPYPIQVWRRTTPQTFERVDAGEGPAWSEVVQGWIQFDEERETYALSTDRAGLERWLTGEEIKERKAEAAQREALAERAARDAAQRRAEAAQRKAEAAERAIEEERNARKAADRRIQELEALLARSR